MTNAVKFRPPDAERLGEEVCRHVRARRRRWISVAVASLSVLGACADSGFRADAEDARRLRLLHADEMYAYLSAVASCEDTAARYIPSTGEPLDFARVEGNHVRCATPAAANGGGQDPSPHDVASRALTVAEATDWEPSIEGGGLRFRKAFARTWATMTLSPGPDALRVDLSLPPHTSDGYPPGPADAARGRACLDAVKTQQPPTPDCPLPR